MAGNGRKLRWIAGLEILSVGLRLVIYDSLVGAAGYELLIPLKPLPVDKHVLWFVAEIDGTDQLFVDRRGAHWTHRYWDWPSTAQLNGVNWKPQEPTCCGIARRQPQWTGAL